MSNLKRLILSCRATEINGVADRIIQKYNEENFSSDTHLTEYFNLLKTENEKLTDAINRTKAKSNLAEKDAARTRSVRGINNMLLGFMQFSDPTINSAAKNVNKIFAAYGVNIIRKSYVTATSLINSLLEDFSAAEIETEIAKLPGLPILIKELKTAQNNFEIARVAYETVIANESSLLNATKLKQKIGTLVNEEIVIYLNVMKKLNAEKYMTFALTVGEMIDNTNEQIKKRRKNDGQPENDNAG